MSNQFIQSLPKAMRVGIKGQSKKALNAGRKREIQLLEEAMLKEAEFLLRRLEAKS